MLKDLRGSSLFYRGWMRLVQLLIPKLLFGALLFLNILTSEVFGKEIVVGSKSFTEGYILSELVSQLIEFRTKHTVKRQFGLGGTGIVYRALESGAIDIYVEYTGTLSDNIFHKPELNSWEKLKIEAENKDLLMSKPLGFNNTYALAVSKDFARNHNIKKISDLKDIQESTMIRTVFGHEFMLRRDGYPTLQRKYGLQFPKIQSMEHNLAYKAIETGQADLIDVYSTDARIEGLGLVLLQDDLKVFPNYEPVILSRRSLFSEHPEVWGALVELEGKMTNALMISLNKQVELDRRPLSLVASDYLMSAKLVDRVEEIKEQEINKIRDLLIQSSREHLFLVLVSLIAAVVVGIPLGFVCYYSKLLAPPIMAFSGGIQTIPSLALLCFMIPVFGIGIMTALVALIVYALLPVILNTLIGLRSIDNKLIETAEALGLTPWQRIRLIELPLASRSILAGVKTSALITIGTATLAALIGSGGYGSLIITGLTTNDMNMILLGAIPASLMAFGFQLLFACLNRLLIPRGLRS